MTHSNHLDPAMPTSEAACRQVEDLLAQAIAFLVKGSNPDNLPTRREALASPGPPTSSPWPGEACCSGTTARTFRTPSARTSDREAHVRQHPDQHSSQHSPPLSAERQSPNHGQRKRVDATNPALESPMFCPASLDPAALSDDLDQG